PPEVREKLRHGPASGAAARPASLRRLPRSLPPAADPALPCKTFIVAHDQLRFELLDGVHRDTDDDQQRGAAKIKVDGQTVQDPLREMTVKPIATHPPGQVVEMDACNHPLRQEADQREINSADQREALQNPADIFAGVAAR